MNALKDKLLRFCTLASGSSGNVCYIETAQTRILVDAGLSGREIVGRMGLIGIEAETLNAIFLTHEHQDHIKGAGPLSRRFGLPVYLSEGTLRKGEKKLGKLENAVLMNAGDKISVNDITVETFTKCHDASDPLGLVVRSNGKKLGVVTDLGRSTAVVEDHLKGCEALVMEFNHDPVMLEEGPYSLELKRRIKGAEGHLSNDQAGDLLASVGHQNLKHLVLAHLSEINNRPEKAYNLAVVTLERLGFTHVEVTVARQDKPGRILEI
ncbi:MAG: MBL fold metallo-hydrolase [Desulfatiglandaceae bacterium]